MDISTLYENKYFLAFFSGLGGVILTLLAQQILNKRGLFTYFVHHSKVGTSVDDANYGSVRVTWNNNPVTHLFISTIELINQSMKDYEDVVVRVFTNNTTLLTHRTEVVGTTHIINFSKDFESQLYVPPGEQPTKQQQHLFWNQRDYLIPTMNRGQKVRFQFLNEAKSETQPSIWLDVLHKGMKLKFQVAHNLVFGVPQPTAALAGIVLGIVFVLFIVSFIDHISVAAFASLLFGLFAQFPGAYFMKIWHRIREWYVG